MDFTRIGAAAPDITAAQPQAITPWLTHHSTRDGNGRGVFPS